MSKLQQFFQTLFNPRSFGVGINERPVTGDQWQMIFPFGDVPSSEDRSLIQRFTREGAVNMKREFDEEKARLGADFRGLPIYIGHPYQMPDVYKDRRRLGDIMDLQVRDDGLYGCNDWNDLGQDNLKQGYWVYPSPGVYFPKPKRGVKIVFPDLMDHVGMTNRPNIHKSKPWTNEEKPNQPTEMKINDEVMKRFKAALGFADNEDMPDDESVNERVTQLLDAHAKQKTDNGALSACNEKLMGHLKKIKDAVAGSESEGAVNEAEADTVVEGILSGITSARELSVNEKGQQSTRITELETQLKTERSTRIGEKLDLLINEGRITKAERPGYETEMAADFEGTMEKLGKRQALNTDSLGLGKAKTNLGDPKSVERTIIAAVNERMKEHNEEYAVAFVAVQKDEKFKHLFAAQETATA